MTSHELVTLDDLLRNPVTVRSVHAGHLTTLRSGSLQDRRAIAHLHTLKLHLGRKYDDVVTESVLAALRKKVKERACDSLLLEEIERSGILTFESFKGDKATGLYVYDRGMLVVGTHIVDGKPVARTMYSVFNTPEQQRHTSDAQRYMHAVVAYAKGRAVDRSIVEILDNQAPMEPTYAGGRLVGNLFLGEAKDMHEILRDASPETKYSLLRDKLLGDMVIAHYARAFAATEKGRKHARKSADAVFTPRDHERFLFEKVFLRADSALRNRLVHDVSATSDGKVLDLERAKTMAPQEATLIAALGLEGTDNMVFVHGDNLPANTMLFVSRDGKTRYTPIDFEFSCTDYPESSLVQCMVKAGIYDHAGVSIRLEDNRYLEAVLLDDAVSVMKKLDPPFDEAGFFDRFNRLKAENYLLWAARYFHYGQSKHVRDTTGTTMLMRYYHTLFINEMIKLGLARDENDKIFAPTKTLFDEPLSELAMRKTHELHFPERRSHSVLKTTFEVDAETKLDDMVRKHRSGQRRRKLGIFGGIVAASALVLGLAFTAGQYREVARDYEFKEKIRKQCDEWTRRDAWLLPESDPRIEMETEMYKLMQFVYGKNNTALAAVYAPELVKRIVERYQTIAWEVVEDHLPHLLAQQIRRYSYGAYVDSWMYLSPTNVHSDDYIPPALDRGARIFDDYKDCVIQYKPNIDLCPLTRKTREGKRPFFGNRNIDLLKRDLWYGQPFQPKKQKLPVGPMFGGP